MNENPPTQEPNFEGEEMKMPENHDVQPATTTEDADSVLSGPVLFVLAVLLILILGALYYWFSSMTATAPSTNPTPVPPPVERPTAVENNEPESTTAEAQADAMLVTSPSDEIDAIEADLEATTIDDLGELQTIEGEINAEVQ